MVNLFAELGPLTVVLRKIRRIVTRKFEIFQIEGNDGDEDSISFRRKTTESQPLMDTNEHEFMKPE